MKRFKLVVAYDGTEGKQQNEDGDSCRCQRPEDARERCLGEGDAGELAADRVLARQENDEGCGRADNPGVNVDAEGLDEALLDRVGDIGRRCGIRHGAFTGLVGEQAALDAGDDSCAESAADSRLRREGIVEDQGEHRRDFIDVEQDDGKGRQEVDASHDGHEEFRELRDARHAAEDDERRQHAEEGSGIDRGNAEGRLGGQRNRVGLYGYVDETERHRDQEGEELGYAGLAQRILDVVGWAAVELAVAARQLVDLGERTLDEARRTAEEGDGPHPEDGAGAARDDGNRDACDVADADARSRADAEGLEGAYRIAFRLVADALRQ